MKRFLTILIPVLLVTVGLVAQEQLELPLVPTKPAPQYTPPTTTLPTLSLPPVSKLTSYKTPGGGLPSISLPQTEPDVTEPTLENFTGGWNTEDFPDNIEDRDALEIENFIWSKMGRLEPRPGYAYYNSTEIDAGEHIWGLYSYHTKDGDKIILAGLDGTLWADTNESATFVSVKTDLESNSKFYEFEMFNKYAIVAHEDDYPFWYAGNVTPATGQLGYPDSLLGAIYEIGETEDGCFSTLIATNQDMEIVDLGWELDYYAGYLLQWHDPSPTAGEGQHIYYFIAGNCSDTLYLEGDKTYVIGTGEAGYFRILPYYVIETPVFADVIGALSTLVCEQDITVTGHGLDVDLADSSYIVKVNNQTQCISWMDANTIRVNEEFDDIAVGDSVYVAYQTFYKARLVRAYKNRLFLAGDQTSDNMVAFSALYDYHDFPKDNYFLVTTEDGDMITALATFYDDQLGYKDDSKDGLIIFKQNSIYKLTFNSAESYYLTQVVDGVGCMAGQTVQVIEGKYMLFLHSSGVYAFDGRTVTLLTKKIDAYIEQLEKDPNHNLAVAGYDDRYYYLSFPFDTSVGGGNCQLDEDPEMVVTWRNYYGGQNRNVWVQKMKLDGTHIGPNKIVEDTTTTMFYAGDADIAFLSNKTFISSYLWTHAQYGNDVAVWRDLSRCTAVTGDRYYVDTTDLDPRLASNHTDMFVFVWEDAIEHKYIGLWAQWFDTTGDSVSGWASIHGGVDADSDSYLEPAVSMNAEGKSIFAWTDYNDAGDGDVYGNIYASRFDSTGNMVGSPWKVNDDASDDFQSSPEVSINNDGKFVIVWADNRLEELNYYQIYAQRYDSAGVAQGSNFRIGTQDSTVVGTQLYPSVSMCENGQFVVTWDDDRFADPYTYAFFQRCDSTGSLIDTNKIVFDSSRFQSSTAQGVQVKMLDDGRFMVIFSANEYDSSSCIWGQLFDSTGTASGSVFRVNDNIANIECLYPYFDLDPNLSAGTSTPAMSDEAHTTLAWSIDYGGWSHIINASSGYYTNQKGLLDTVNMIFADPTDRSYIYQYGQVFQDTGQDISVLFKSKAFDFNSISNQKRVTRFFINYYLDAGSFDLTFYTDFGDTSRYTTSVTGNGGNRYARVPLDWTTRGRNFSYKIESTDDLRIDKIRLRLKVEED